MKREAAGGLGGSQNMEDPQSERRESARVVRGRGQEEAGDGGTEQERTDPKSRTFNWRMRKQPNIEPLQHSQRWGALPLGVVRLQLTLEGKK